MFSDDEVCFAKAVTTPFLWRCMGAGEWALFSDGEVRFAKAVATPYLSHCKGAGEWGFDGEPPSPHPICRIAQPSGGA